MMQNSSLYLIDQAEAEARVGAAINPRVSCVIKRGLFDVWDEGSGMWVVMDEAIVWSHRLLKAIVIPRFFLTNFASIPWWARWLIAVNGRHRYAALAHDLLYSGQQLGFQVSRSMADLVLRDFCEALQVPEWKTSAMWAAVRVGGGNAYNAESAVVMADQHQRWMLAAEHRALFEWMD